MTPCRWMTAGGHPCLGVLGATVASSTASAALDTSLAAKVTELPAPKTARTATCGIVPSCEWRHLAAASVACGSQTALTHVHHLNPDCSRGDRCMPSSAIPPC